MHLSLPVLIDIQAPPDFVSVIQQLAARFMTAATALIGTLNQTVIALSRLAYVSLLMIGALLYYSHVERRLGKDLVKGAIVLAVLAEFVFPLIGKI
jgi:hypothetical protein